MQGFIKDFRSSILVLCLMFFLGSCAHDEPKPDGTCPVVILPEEYRTLNKWIGVGQYRKYAYDAQIQEVRIKCLYFEDSMEVRLMVYLAAKRQDVMAQMIQIPFSVSMVGPANQPIERRRYVSVMGFEYADLRDGVEKITWSLPIHPKKGGDYDMVLTLDLTPDELSENMKKLGMTPPVSNPQP